MIWKFKCSQFDAHMCHDDALNKMYHDGKGISANDLTGFLSVCGNTRQPLSNTSIAPVHDSEVIPPPIAYTCAGNYNWTVNYNAPLYMHILNATRGRFIEWCGVHASFVEEYRLLLFVLSSGLRSTYLISCSSKGQLYWD
jgi:hypothetical protein